MTRGRGGNNGGPWGRGPNTPPPPPSNNNGNNDIDELIRRSQEKLRTIMPSNGGNGKLTLVFALIGLLVWLGSGIYMVEPAEEGVVMRFGKFVDTAEPGLHYNWPAPIGKVYKPEVTRVHSIDIGQNSFKDRSQNKPDEGRMLTGDNNVVMVAFSVQWTIKDAKKYLFNVRNPDDTVKDAAESVMRDVIGNNTLNAAIADDKTGIINANERQLQELLNEYGTGIKIERIQMKAVTAPEEVKDAFDDVQAAGQDQETTINRAIAYANEILPIARGESEKLLQDAQAYRAQVVNRAEGDAARFVSIYDEYKNAKDITKKRLYLETIEEIMKGMDKVIMDDQSGSGVVPYMALPEIKKNTTTRQEK
ncbi:MAG: FtsH protease activity modulator HflK [Alphaproteobacteria bacterium]|nr:FtsH protease activity modulator HflK [Alphaproteobacteria bacterium]